MRVKIIQRTFIILLCLLSVRLFFLQVYPTKQVMEQYKNHQTETVSTCKYRVFDTNYKDLMNYSKKYVVVFDKKPFSLNNYENSMEKLMIINYIMKEDIIDFDFNTIMINPGKTYYTVCEDTYNKVKTITGIKGMYSYITEDVNNKDAWEISSFLSRITEENENEDTIQGVLYEYIKNNEIPSKDFYLGGNSEYKENTISNVGNNKNIKLTTDSELEKKVREVLLKEEYLNLSNVGVTIMESDTGKIKAMVQKDESQPNINLGIEGVGYEPGSIFKLITLGAALDKGYVTMNTKLNCVGNVCNKSHIHGTITVENALVKSCNDSFAIIGNKLKYDNLMEYAEKLNIFKKDLNFKEESTGIKPLEESGLNNISIGQCLTVTPIQMLGAINSIVNGGVYIKPYIVDSIVDANDTSIKTFETETKKVFSKTTSTLIKNGMEKVVKEGTGIKANVEGIKIGGKTGSATSGTLNSTHGWFVGYYTINNKTYTMIVFVPDILQINENGEELGGGDTAAPIFADIIKNIINSK